MQHSDNTPMRIAGKLIAKIVIIISVIELLIMTIFANLPQKLPAFEEALIDSLLLSVLSAPLIYYWIIKPFVEARKEAEIQLSHMAFHDPLTQLPNRRFLNEYMKKTLAVCAKHDMSSALLLIDLDNFKQINDTHGHDAGDALLIACAKRLSSIIRSEDIIARLGGDEFVAAIHPLGDNNNQAKANAATVAKKFLEVLNQPFSYQSTTLHTKASIGVYMLSADSKNIDNALKQADMAMYRAKKQGNEKERIVFFNEFS